MTVKPRGTSYQATVYHKGARHRQDFDTERAALIWEAETLAKLRRGEVVTGASGKVVERTITNIGHVYERAQSHHWDRLKGSRGAVANAKMFVQWVGEKTAPEKALAQAMIDAWVTHLMKERNVSNSTINRHMSALSVLIKHAKIDAKPTLPWFKAAKGRVRFFSDEEEAQIIQAWTLWGFEREVDFIVFLLDSGARPYAEAAAFTWRDLGQRTVTFWDTKNTDSRTIPLTTRAWEAVQRQPKDDAGPFTSIDQGTMRRLWERTQGHLPALADAVLYTTRHTTASRLVQRGVDLRRVKEWMGHRSIQTTLIYAHLAPKHLLEGVEALERKPGNLKVVSRTAGE